MFDNKAAVIGRQEGRKQEVNGCAKKQERTCRKKNDKGAGRKSAGGETDGRKEGEQEQVRKLLRKVEDMLQEKGGWRFSLYMYQRLEEEWSRREEKLRARLEAETDVGSVRRKQKTVEKKNKHGARAGAEVRDKRRGGRREAQDRTREQGGMCGKEDE